MYTINTIAEFGRGKDRGQRKKRQKLTQPPGYTPKVKQQNIDFLYKNMYGGNRYAKELARNPNNKLNYGTAKQYIRDMATNYENSMSGNVLNENKVNRGMNSINKKYKQYF